MKYKAVFFDADNTVLKFSEPVPVTYSHYLSQSGFAVSSNDLAKVLPEIWKQFLPFYLKVNQGYKTSPVEEKEAWFYFFSLVNKRFNLQAGKEVFEQIYLHYSRCDSRLVFDGMEEILRLLKSNNIITGVISNNDDRILKVLNALPIGVLLDHIYPSSQLGFKKPAKEVFDIVLHELKLLPQEVIYIGDDLELDYQAGSHAGIRSILLDYNLLSGLSSDQAVKNHVDLLALLRNLLDL